MRIRIPVRQLLATYVGCAPEREYEFTDRSTGEVRSGTSAAKHRFLVEQSDGDVDVLTLPQGQLDRCAKFDTAELGRGTQVVIDGTAILGTDDGERSFFALLSIVPA
jgi:hypothetical protein